MTCPGPYSLFNEGCYRYVSDKAFGYLDAAATCHDSENGWLATMNTRAKLGVVSFFGISEHLYFGLYKTSACSSSDCDGKYAWDTCPGCVAPVGNYTLNMKR